MKLRALLVLTISFALTFAAIPAFPHHGFAAEFDIKKPITITGTLTKIEWTNPHAFLYIDAKDETGKVVNWAFELGSPNGLMRRGWTRHSLKVGDTITVDGYCAKDGSRIANARSVKLSDGRTVFAGSPDDGGPAQ